MIKKMIYLFILITTGSSSHGSSSTKSPLPNPIRVIDSVSTQKDNIAIYTAILDTGDYVHSVFRKLDNGNIAVTCSFMLRKGAKTTRVYHCEHKKTKPESIDSMEMIASTLPGKLKAHCLDMSAKANVEIR